MLLLVLICQVTDHLLMCGLGHLYQVSQVIVIAGILFCDIGMYYEL